MNAYKRESRVVKNPGNKTKYTSIVNGPINTITDKNGNTVDVIYSSNLPKHQKGLY